MKVVAVIPARYGSSRLPGKPLADINGKPMVQWVYENAKRSKLCTQVYVATDDERIASAVRAFGGEVVMTSVDIENGTDRMAEVARQRPGDIFVNVQGDEPLLEGTIIDHVLQPILQGRFEMSSIRVALKSNEDLMNPNVVKVIVDDQDRALYFSRYPIPYSRQLPSEAKPPYLCSQHVGIYAFRKETLLQVSALRPCELEKAESLEQLRAMKAGISIGVILSDFLSVGVDTAHDLNKVRGMLRAKGEGNK